jgi:hypothetical protein
MGFLFSPVENPETKEIDDVKAVSYAAGVCAKEIKRYREFKGLPSNTEVKSVIKTNPYE